MKSLCNAIPSPTDATAFYRSTGVMYGLLKELNIRNLSFTTYTWADIVQVDAAFFQRPWGVNIPQIIDMFHDQGKKVWVDYDDDLFSVPLFNKTHKIYSDKKAQNAMASVLAKADKITVSTEALKVKYSRILEAVKDGNPNDKSLILNPDKIVLCPNAYNAQFMGPIEKTGKQKKVVLWRGSSTHDKDLLQYTGAISQVMEKHPDFVYTFVGAPFWLSIEKFEDVPGINDKNLVVAGMLDPIEYLRFLREIKPALVIVPLHDCEFNRSKSNIAWIEATMAGAVCLAPNWPEWQRPGVLTYENESDFTTIMNSYLSGEIDGLKLWDESAEYIRDCLTIGKVNKIRRSILEEITA